MSAKFTTDIVREIWDENIGTKKVVRPHRQRYVLVELISYNIDGGATESMAFTSDEALLVAEALIACAKEMSKEKNPEHKVSDY